MKHNQSKWKFNFKFSRTKNKLIFFKFCICARGVIRERCVRISRFITHFMFWWYFFPQISEWSQKDSVYFDTFIQHLNFSVRTQFFRPKNAQKRKKEKPHVKKIRICYLFALRQVIFHLNENINTYFWCF